MRKLPLVRVGIDTGGTFTDFAVAIGSRTHHFKVPSTPNNPAEAILDGINRVFVELGIVPADIVHGTTVATNALLERKGARTALITTEGFEDVIEIGRQARPEIYNFMVMRPAPLVPRELRIGVPERTGPDGSILEPLQRAAVAEVVERLVGAPEGKASAKEGASDKPVESVAVCLLFSFANPLHERRIADALAPLGLPISLSHEILPEYREYERTSTTVINAYLVPLMSRYLKSLSAGLAEAIGGQWSKAGRIGIPVGRKNNREGPRAITAGTNVARVKPLLPHEDWRSPVAGLRLRVMQSNGGSVSAATAAREPVRAILSGPAGGVVGALRAASATGIRDIITFDMGGTSTDVALCRGEAKTTNEAVIAGLPVAVPVIDIHTVGAGGGSIARIDEAGALRVGPESAGADPGPACYGRGDQPAVTDANLVLGRFGGASLLGGEMKLDAERARRALSHLASEMSRFSRKAVSVERAAMGVIRVANANMEAALRVVSVERGQDPRFFTLVCFGGAGGLHACDLAAGLGIPRVLVPRSPGTLSALGVLLGDVVKDYSRTVMLKAADDNRQQVRSTFAELESHAIHDLRDEGFEQQRIKLARSAALRYVGQSFEIEVPWSGRVGRAFHAAHRERYGYADSGRAAEIVSLRVRALGATEKPRLPHSTSLKRPVARAIRHERVRLANGPGRVPVYERDALAPGAKVKGPAIIVEYSSTTLVPSGWKAGVDGWLNLSLSEVKQ